MIIVLSSFYTYGGDVLIDCNYNANPDIRLSGHTKIEWVCSLENTYYYENFSCVSQLYDAENLSYLIQVNPSIDDYTSKTTLVGGKTEIKNINRYFKVKNSQVIVYFDGSVFDNIRNNITVTGAVLCRGNLGDKALFLGNFTPKFANYETENIYRTSVISENSSLIVALILGIIILGIISVVILYFYKNSRE